MRRTTSPSRQQAGLRTAQYRTTIKRLRHRKGVRVAPASLALLVALFACSHPVATSKPASTGDCQSWGDRIIALQSAGVTWDNAGRYVPKQYARALSALQEADSLAPPCLVDAEHNGELFGLRIATKQLLVAGLLGTHDFRQALQVATAALTASGFDSESAWGKASDLVLSGEFGRAFALYSGGLKGFVSDPGEIDLGTWTTYQRAVASGARGHFGESVRLFASIMPSDYRDMNYLYGVSLLASGDRCNAYSEFTSALSEETVTTHPVSAIMDESSISALRAIKTIYLDRLSNPEIMSILRKC